MGRIALLTLHVVVWLVVASVDASAQPEPEAPEQEPAEDPPPDPEDATPDPIDYEETLIFAENSWLFGDYESVIRVLDPLVFPEPKEGLTREQLIAIYELLGASRFLQTGRHDAEPAFHELLRLEPEYRLDPFLYPASVVDYLDYLRTEVYADELAEILAGRTGTQDPLGVRFVERTVEERSLAVSMMPFGIGLFVNDEPGWGSFYLSTEVTLATISVAMYMTNELSRDDNGYVPDQEVAERRQRIQIGTGVAFVAVFIANIIHGAVVHEDIVQTSYGIIDEPPPDFTEPQSSVLRLDGWVSDDGWLFGVSGKF